MSELDKFKRRTIRSVARLLLKEKKPPEDLWKQMKKETGTDCRVLWERMRALCIKKLNLMIGVDDRSASLPSMARLSLTDWLLVDLVLVHEEIDVIAMDKDDGTDYPALIELFNLVQRFDIEGRRGELLAEAWAAGTVFYNRQGRQCSPMLLQRRWYQLKKLTRCRFYKFWFSYRGNTRLLEEARKSMPTRLQMAIAKRYPQMITAEFPDWEDLIEKGSIIMPEEFEAKMRMPNLPKPCSSNAPDLVLVEPVIETIDLRVESDPEDHNHDDAEDTSDPEKSNDATDVATPTEEQTTTYIHSDEITKAIDSTEEDGLSNVQLISATHVPEVEIPDESPDESPEAESPNQDEGEVDMEESHIENGNDDNELDVIVIPSIVPANDVNLDQPNDDTLQTVTAHGSLNNANKVPGDVETINDSDDGIDDIIKVKADEFCRKAEDIPAEDHNIIDDLIKDRVDTFLKKPKEDMPLSENKPDVSNINLISKKKIAAIDLMADLNFVDDGIEFVDDGVEFVEEDATRKNEPPCIDTPPVNEKQGAAEENKFDLKLLMYPVVYTTKIDKMKTFTNKQFTTVANKEDIEKAIIESKPISRKAFSMKLKQENVTSIVADTADSDDIFTNQEVTDDEELEEDEKVSPNSYMLKKPRTRTYDLIKLCKNPDFNTKLKRLTIGFLSSTRNRHLLNACIPMTIDLSKAFEPKLVNRTLYLKSSGTTPIKVKQEVIDDKQLSSIIPTAMPVQSLMNNSKVDIHNLISNQSPPGPVISERTKVINLPDIDKVRRINQQLLTAQVPPLRVFSGSGRKETPPVSLAPNEAEVAKDHTYAGYPTASSTPLTVPGTPLIDPVIESTSSNTPPIKVKVEGDKSSITTESTDTVTSTPTEILTPAKEKLLKMINQAKISTQEALAKIEDSVKPDDFPMPIVVNEVKANVPLDTPRKYGSQPRVPLAWAPRFTQPPKNLDNLGLLTTDTLNKMLHLLMSGNEDGSGCKCCALKKKTAKKKKSKAEREEAKKEAESSKKKQAKNSESAPTDEAVSQDLTTEEVSPEDKTKGPKVKTRLVVLGRVVKYCCWAKEKLCNRRRITKHKCLPRECKCCCAEELALKILEDERKKIKEREIKVKNNEAIELSDDEEDSLRKACESIETVVKQSGDVTNTDFGQIETPAVQTMVIRPIPSIKVASSTSSPVKVSVGVTQLELQLNTPSIPPKAPFIQTVRAAPVASLMPKRPPATRITQIVPRPQVRQPSQWVPCSCKKPAVSQDSRWNIVIDASASNCARHPPPIAPTIPVAPTAPIVPTTPIAPKQPVPLTTPIAPKTQEKVLYLQSNSIAKKPSESPIFLGKNKILLTTVKFPRKTDDMPPPDVFQAPKIIPTLPLPAGVQLVLMPSGNVTYTLDPGVELDEAQLANLPTILAAVQEQLNASGPVITSDAVAEPQVGTTLDVEPVTAVTEMSVLESTNLPTSGEAVEMAQAFGNNITQTTGSPEAESITLKANEVSRDTGLPSNTTNVMDMEVDAESTKIDAPVPQETPTIVPQNETASLTDDTVSKATVDSEVPQDNNEMVMPQITSVVGGAQIKETQGLAERREESNDEDGSNNRKSLLSDLMEMSGISTEDTVAPEPIVPVPPLTNLQNTPNVTGNEEIRHLPELNPVTSFAELKYACEQDGKFFKLDFETGVIIPINVCIKRNPKNKPFATKECIDLTDDVESSGVKISTTQDQIQSAGYQCKGPQEYIYKGQTLSVPTVKPVKLFKAFRPTPTMLKVKRAGRPPVDSPFNISKQSHIEKRKQNLTNAKVEARIDLLDSDDEPMEEEYLVDSSDEDSRTTDYMPIEALDPSTQSDDSSDDEPLAKKFKRLRDGDEKEEHVRETNIYDEIPDEPLKVPRHELTLRVRRDFGESPLVSIPTMDKVVLNTTTPQASTLKIDVVAPASVSVGSNLNSPIAKNNSPSKETLPSDAPMTSELDMFPADASEDEELDKSQPDIGFMSDPSDEEGGEDCILGF